jgi:hypothetical protein
LQILFRSCDTECAYEAEKLMNISPEQPGESYEPIGEPQKSGSKAWRFVLIGCGGCLCLIVLAVVGFIVLAWWAETEGPEPPVIAELTLSPDEAEEYGRRIAEMSGEEIQQLLEPILREFKFAALFIHPLIPPDKLQNARETTQIPEEEVVFGLMDSTVQGSAKHCLLFSGAGIYYHNDWSGAQPGPGFVPYSDFPTLDFGEDKWLEVSLGGNRYLDISGMSSGSWAAPTLRRVRLALVEAVAPAVEPARENSSEETHAAATPPNAP